MRDLRDSDRNILVIHDPMSGTDIEVHYRPPTTRERVAYKAALFRKEGKKIVMNVLPVRVEYALKVITGFRAGDFGYDGQPMSSEPGAAGYREDWKDLLKETAADILDAFSAAVFEGAKAVRDPGYELVVEEAGEEAGEDEPPLAKS